MIKKGFNLFKPLASLISNKVIGLREPMCCEVCKGCLFHIGKLICKFRNATLVDFDNYCLNERGKKK